MSKKFHYTYYSYEEFGRGYIGSRTTKISPEEDKKYFGSFSDKTFKPTQKIILKIYETREQALKDEIILHEFYDVANNPHFANKAKQTSTKFIISGQAAIKNGRNAVMVYLSKYTLEQRCEIAKKAQLSRTPLQRHEAAKIREENKTPEQRSKIAKKANSSRTSEKKSEIAKKGAKKRILNMTSEQINEMARIARLGITPEKRTEASKKGAAIMNNQKWKCTETGYISTSGGLSRYQKSRGIDTSKRLKIL